MANVTWFYKEDGARKGPVAELDLSALFSGGRLPPETQVSQDGEGGWAEARTVAAFSGSLSGVPSPSAATGKPPIGKLERDDDADPQRAPEVRPWVRFWARCIDGLLLTALVMPLFMLMVGGFGVFQLLLWVGFCLTFEAVTTSLLSATPGKWLLGVSVRTVDGERLSLGQSFMRAARVLLLGMGLGVPVINLVTMFLSYRRLMAEGWTLWDTFGPFSVSHKPIGVGRSSMGALATAACLVLILVVRPGASGMGAGPRGAMANDPYAPKSGTRSATQPASQPTTRLVIQPSQRKMQSAPLMPATKPAVGIKPTVKQGVKPGAKPATKQPVTRSGKPLSTGKGAPAQQPAQQR